MISLQRPTYYSARDLVTSHLRPTREALSNIPFVSEALRHPLQAARRKLETATPSSSTFRTQWEFLRDMKGIITDTLTLGGTDTYGWILTAAHKKTLLTLKQDIDAALVPYIDFLRAGTHLLWTGTKSKHSALHGLICLTMSEGSISSEDMMEQLQTRLGLPLARQAFMYYVKQNIREKSPLFQSPTLVWKTNYYSLSPLGRLACNAACLSIDRYLSDILSSHADIPIEMKQDQTWTRAGSPTPSVLRFYTLTSLLHGEMTVQEISEYGDQQGFLEHFRENSILTMVRECIAEGLIEKGARTYSYTLTENGRSAALCAAKRMHDFVASCPIEI